MLTHQNDRHFTDDIFKCILVNERFCILIRISLNFVPKGPIGNKSTLVRVMTWRRTDDKPLPEPMLTQFTDAYLRLINTFMPRQNGHRFVDGIFNSFSRKKNILIQILLKLVPKFLALVRVMAWRQRLRDKPLSGLIYAYLRHLTSS